MFACFAAPSYSSERKQRQLLPHEQKELDARAKELKSLKGLKRVQMGQAGPTAGWLATIGVQLACHELLEVVLPQGSPYPREFVSDLLENSQDCVPVSSRGRFLVMYRDRNLPRPAPSLLPGRAPPPLPESSDGRGSSHPLPTPSTLQPSSLTQAELTSGSRGSNQVPKAAPRSSNASSGGQTVPHDPAYMQAWASAQSQGPGTAGSQRDSVPDAAGARLGAGDSSPPLAGRRASHYHRDTELLAPASASSAKRMPDRLKRALAIRLSGLRLRLKRTQCG
ncbi:hypothetical protein QJQ45_004623 [Haematococcus lacustris]|nr:hypothetical protein QJQ45_004623 [Haematococcus lacustris]